MKIFSALIILFTVTLVCWTDYRLDQWEHVMAEYEASILHGQDPNFAGNKQTFEELPTCVQQFLRNAVPAAKEHGVNSHSSVSIDQKGWIEKTKGRWTPFVAHQVLSLMGYSWEAAITALPMSPEWFPRIRVADAYTNEKGGISKAAFLAIFYVKNLFQGGYSHQASMDHAMRWLSDTVLIPTVLFPEQGIVTWSAVEDNPGKAILTLQFPEDDLSYARSRLDMEATFSGGWMTSLKGKRLVLNKDFQLQMKVWQVNLSGYQEQEHGMWVPRYFEHGWINEQGDTEVYFKADYLQLHYHPSTEAESQKTSITAQD